MGSIIDSSEGSFSDAPEAERERHTFFKTRLVEEARPRAHLSSRRSKRRCVDWKMRVAKIEVCHAIVRAFVYFV